MTHKGWCFGLHCWRYCSCEMVEYFLNWRCYSNKWDSLKCRYVETQWFCWWCYDRVDVVYSCCDYFVIHIYDDNI